MAEEIMLNAEQNQHSELEDRYLLFYIQDMLYSVELRYVIEIIAVQTATHLPNLPVYIKGIINLRGKVIPVIDMRLKLGLPEREYDDKTCIVVIDISDIHIGLIVDSVSEVVTISEAQISDTPSGDIAEKYISSVSTNTDGCTILNIDSEKLFINDFGTIVAQ